MNFIRRQLDPALRQIAGWVSLLVYIGVASPFGSGVTALAGCLDPSHHLCIRMAGAGPQVVLQHSANCAHHRHGAVARTLTLLAQPTVPGQPDHVIQFAGAENFTRTTSLAAPDRSMLVADADLPDRAGFSALGQIFSRNEPPRPPPEPGGLLLQIRSIVLLV